MDLQLNYYFDDHSFFPIECNQSYSMNDLLNKIKEDEKDVDGYSIFLNGKKIGKEELLKDYINYLHYNAIYISKEPSLELKSQEILFNVDDYDIISKIGGYSYKGVHKKTNKLVFIKLFENRPFSAYLNMIRGTYIIRSLNSPYFQKLISYKFSLTKEDLKPFGCKNLDIITVSKFYENGSVEDNVDKYIKSKGTENDKMNPTIRSKIIFGVAAAMKKLHQNQIVYRNLSPKNVFLDENLEPVLSNFYFSKYATDKRDYGYYTVDCFLRCDIQKISPEIYYDSSEHGTPTDVFSYAIFLYRMFSVIKGLNTKKPIRSHQQYAIGIAKGFRPIKTEEIPEPYWYLIQRCWCQDPCDRLSFDQITEILRDDNFALNEFGMQTDLTKLHEYQNRVDPIENTNDDVASLKAELAKLKKKLELITNKQQEDDTTHKFTVLDSKFIESLRTIREINTGGFGRVIEVGKETSYALKMMHIKKGQIELNKVQKFVREYEILYQMKHPNIVRSFGIFMGDEKTAPSILLEYCTQDIADAINDKEKAKNNKIVIWVYQIIEAMKYVHKCNIIHRDLKPSNILIGNDGLIKVTDFGISKLMSSEQQSESLGAGSQKFMAPELLNENKNYSEKVDVYSFGVLLYFMLSGGEMPQISVVQMGNGKKAEIPPSFTDFAKKIISDCWNFMPQERPSFEEILQQFEDNEYKILNLTDAQVKDVKLFIEKHKLLIQY